eukprot:scaffold38451_cov43-Phaeocystis_antarctica.AAC.1
MVVAPSRGRWQAPFATPSRRCPREVCAATVSSRESNFERPHPGFHLRCPRCARREHGGHRPSDAAARGTAGGGARGAAGAAAAAAADGGRRPPAGVSGAAAGRDRRAAGAAAASRAARGGAGHGGDDRPGRHRLVRLRGGALRGAHEC